ncbi:MAG: hypothetical protein LPJ98_11410, partial [Cyclobacteriaceae bacterium]|nr:hypothetical protein [Cyclobacteriaceae bacterium]
ALNYYYILNPTNHLNWTLGYQILVQSLKGGLSQEGSSTEFSEFDNDNEFGFKDAYLGMTWKTKWGKWILSPSAYLHQYSWRDIQLEDENTWDKILVLPGWYAKWNIKSNRSLTYRFQTEANFMDIQKLAQGYVLQDYTAIFQGNRMLDNGVFANHSLSYNHFDMFSGLTLFGNMNYQRKRNEIITTTDFAGINRLLTLMNIEPVNESLNGDLRLDKALNKMKFELGGRWNAFKTNLFLNETPTQNRQFSQTYDTKLTTTFFKVLEVDFVYSFSANQYHSGNAQNTFTTHSPKLDIDLDIFKGLKLKAYYTYNTYLNQGTSTQSDFDFLNAFLIYQGNKSPWEINLSVGNIFDTIAIRRHSFSENL